MDPAEAKRLLPFKPCDQTSNQRLVYEQMVSPENREMFLKTVKELKEQGWEAILDRMVSTVFLDSSLLFGGLTDDMTWWTLTECAFVCEKHRKLAGSSVAAILSLPCIRY